MAVRTITYPGPPTSGSWSAGDVAVDDDAKTWVCLVDGSPGTWVSGAAKSFDVAAYGAKCDGVTNDTAAIQAALTAASASGGGVVALPVGKTLVGGSLTVPAHVVIAGAVTGPFDLSSTAQLVDVPAVLVTSTTTTPFVFASRDAGIQDLCVYYPTQVAPTASTPTVYPATITAPTGSAGVRIRRVTIVNGYVGLSLKGGRHFVEDLNLGCFSNAIAVDKSADVIHISRIQCSPFWDTIAGLSYPQTIDTWVGSNHTTLTVKRADGMVVMDLFAFHGHFGWVMSTSATGTPKASYGSFSNVRFDTFTQGVRCIATQAPGWEGSGLFVNSSTVPVTLPSGGGSTPRFRAVGGSFWGTGKTPANAAAGNLDLKAIDGFNPRGYLSTQTKPATGTTAKNSTGADAMFYLTGGTVTAVTIGGHSTGLTSGWFRVPANGTYKITYSGTPTFAWYGD